MKTYTPEELKLVRVCGGYKPDNQINWCEAITIAVILVGLFLWFIS